MTEATCLADGPDRPVWLRLLNGTGSLLRRLGTRWPRLDAEKFMAAAQRRTGLSDFGHGHFRDGLRVLVESFDRQDSAHTFGRLFFREFCIRLLASRLRVEHDLVRYPEIHKVEIRRPLFITGLPRSGTTLMHRLLSQAPGARALRFWETLEPSPPPETATARSDPRIARAWRAIRDLEALAPGIRAAHSYEAEAPEECNSLFAQNFAAAMLPYMFDAPAYIDWLRELDRAANYRYFRSQLQLLSWHDAGEYWVLKAPAHLFSLDVILEVFPDARFVVTHRDPQDSIASACSLAAAYRSITVDKVDLNRLGAEVSQVLAAGMEWALGAREAADPSRFFDVSYPTLLNDPAGVTRAICEQFDYRFDPAAEERLRLWLAENPKGKHGPHRYDLAEFGLDATTINNRFASYRDWLATHVSPDPCRRKNLTDFRA
jgi:hypothetical protein